MQSPDQQKAIVQRMIDAGESEENIATVIQHFKTTPPPTAEAKTGKATLGDYFRLAFPQVDAAIGVAKGAASTAVGLGELVHKIPGVSNVTDALYGMPSGSSQASFGAQREELKPSNPQQQAGFVAEQIGENFLPAGAVRRGAQALRTGSRVLNMGARAGLEGAAGAAVHTAQTGSTDGAGFVGAAGAAGGAVAPAAARAVGGTISKLGQKVEGWLINAGKKDIDNGFKIGNVFRYQLGGTVQQTLEKAQTKLGQLSSDMKAELNRVGPNGHKPMVDVWGAIQDAEAELTAKAAKTTGTNAGIQRALDNIKSEVRNLSGGGGTGVVTHGVFDLPTANEIKQGIGDLGAWQSGRVDPDANATEIVANAIYGKLRAAVEKSAPNGSRIAELNRQMGDIIPIRQAIMRRIPVAERQRMIGLGEMIGFASGNWWIPAADRVLRSGPMANQLVNFGGDMQQMTGRMSGPGAAGAASQVKR